MYILHTCLPTPSPLASKKYFKISKKHSKDSSTHILEAGGFNKFLQGQIFHIKTGENIPNDHKIYQMATKYTKWLENI
jgi:hypothetical protein